jgi:hypothetical protein
LTSLPAAFPVPEPVARENGKDYSIPTQPCGEKDSAASLSAAPDSVLLNNLKEWSDADFEQCLGDCEWQDTLTKLKLSRRSSLARVTLDPDCLSFPTLTSGDRSLTSRPAGQTKCEKWFKDNGLIPPGYQLSAPAMALMMGFPEDWFDCLSPPITQDGSGLDTSPEGLSRQDKRRSPSNESSTSTTSFLEDKSGEISSRKMPNSSQFLEDKSGDNSSRKKRRHKGDGSGCIYWRTVTKKGKTYHEAYYQYELWSEGERLLKSTKYIPKRLLKGVQALEAANAPIIDVLRVLGVGQRPGKSSICPACQQPLPSLERGCGVCGWISPKKKSPTAFLGEIQDEQPAEPKSPKKIPQAVFLGEIQDEPPADQKSPKKNPSGHIGPVIQRKKDKSGWIVEYPKMEGERVPIDLAWDYPHQFIWIYNWSVKEDGSWKNRSKSVPRNRIWSVRSAIATNKPVEEILKLIEQP